MSKTEEADNTEYCPACPFSTRIPTLFMKHEHDVLSPAQERYLKDRQAEVKSDCNRRLGHASPKYSSSPDAQRPEKRKYGEISSDSTSTPNHSTRLPRQDPATNKIPRIALNPDPRLAYPHGIAVASLNTGGLAGLQYNTQAAISQWTSQTDESKIGVANLDHTINGSHGFDACSDLPGGTGMNDNGDFIGAVQLDEGFTPFMQQYGYPPLGPDHL